MVLERWRSSLRFWRAICRGYILDWGGLRRFQCCGDAGRRSSNNGGCGFVLVRDPTPRRGRDCRRATCRTCRRRPHDYRPGRRARSDCGRGRRGNDRRGLARQRDHFARRRRRPAICRGYIGGTWCGSGCRRRSGARRGRRGCGCVFPNRSRGDGRRTSGTRWRRGDSGSRRNAPSFALFLLLLNGAQNIAGPGDIRQIDLGLLIAIRQPGRRCRCGFRPFA